MTAPRVSNAQIVHWDVWKVYTEGPAHATFEVWEPDAMPLPVREVNPFQEALF